MARPTTSFLTAAALAASLLACGGDREAAPGDGGAPPADRASDTSAADGAGAERRFVQLASLSSAEGAQAMRDSLAAAGWSAFVGEATVDGAQRWRVHVLPTRSAELARLAEFALRAGKHEALAASGQVPGDALGDAPAVVRVWRVNDGTKGMARSVRWAHSPDHGALLVVDDPVSVEAEALPDGFLHASDRTSRVLQVDSVWDVAPSPDWRWLAYSHAYRTRAAEQEQPGEDVWRDLGRRAGLPMEEARRRAFMASGMAYIYGLAVPVVRQVGDGADGEERRVDVAAGWRAAWTTSGALAAFGTAPRTVQDDSPSPSFILVDPATGATRDSAGDASGLARVAWTEGPTLDISLPFDHASRRSVEGGGRTITSQGGWVRVRERGESGAGRIVGPGSVLAATASGRFVLVLALDPAAREYESPDVALVYELGP